MATSPHPSTACSLRRLLSSAALAPACSPGPRPSLQSLTSSMAARRPGQALHRCERGGLSCSALPQAARMRATGGPYTPSHPVRTPTPPLCRLSASAGHLWGCQPGGAPDHLVPSVRQRHVAVTSRVRACGKSRSSEISRQPCLPLPLPLLLLLQRRPHHALVIPRRRASRRRLPHGDLRRRPRRGVPLVRFAGASELPRCYVID
jgi:hypothetical protein